MSWFKDGTVAVTNASATVTGTGTTWIANAKLGEEFRLEGGQRGYEIVGIVSDTEITIDPAYLDSTQTGQNYRIVPVKGFLQRAYDALSAATATIEGYISGPLAGRFGAGSVGAPGLANDSDTDTGFYWKAANQLAAVTGGVQRWLLSSTAMLIDVPITGTAVQSNLKDATPGKLTKVGAFGWGIDDASLDSSPGDDLDALTIQGVWRYSSGTTGAPSTAGNVIHLTRLSGAYMQIAMSNTGLIYVRSYASSVWSSWVEMAQQGASVSFADIIGTGLLALGGNAIGGEMQTIADDAVGTFTPPRNGGFARITCAGTGPTPTDTLSCDIFYDVGSSLLIKKSTGWATLGSSVDFVDTDVTGITGTDGGATIAVQSGVIKIENRIGGARTFEATFE